MSLILDALKKVDDEKKKAGKEPMDIAVDILRQEKGNPKRRILVLSGVVALSVVIAATAAYVNLVVKKPAAASPAAHSGPLNTNIAEPSPVIVNQIEPERPSPGRGTSEPDNAMNKKQSSTDNPKKMTAPVERADSPALRQDMVISVIVWYEEPSERKAVINGTAVKEGEIFEGARVEQIYPSRIVFVKDGKSFERSMNK